MKNLSAPGFRSYRTCGLRFLGARRSPPNAVTKSPGRCALATEEGPHHSTNAIIAEAVFQLKPTRVVKAVSSTAMILHVNGSMTRTAAQSALRCYLSVL